MLLRTTSAPVAQSCLFSDSPNRDLEYILTNAHHEYYTNKKNISFPHHAFQHLSSFSCSLSSSPVRSSSVGRKAVRRVQSDSNLEGLAFPTTEESFHSSRKLMSGSNKSMLHTEPSFSIYDKFEELEELRNEEKEKEIGEGKLERSATIGESIEAQFSFGRDMMMKIIEEDEEGDKEEENERFSNKFKDFKIDINGEAMSNPSYRETEIGSDGVDLDSYYNKMVRKEPSNPLVLRNYAQFLESKRDLAGAEEYYSRAMLADPKDGEILCKYAKLVWELHGDQTRASHYFKRATQASPEDSNVLAAYASFLWDVGESDDEEHSPNTKVDENSGKVGLSDREFIKEEMRPSSPPLHLAMGLGIDMTGFDGGNNGIDYQNTSFNESNTVEEYYKRMVEENPRNPLFLRNYAHFLHQTKGDLAGAEEYYSRAILQDPSDGQILSLYAGIVWQLHRDNNRADAYFERAVQAAPEDSNVLAAYAKFLWEADGDEDALDESQCLIPISQAATNAY